MLELLKSAREKYPFFRKCNLAGDGNDAPLSRWRVRRVAVVI